MNLILLSGGSGKRLWPLSNEIRSKQFVKVLKNEEGQMESMIERVYRQVRQVSPDSTITIATAKAQVSSIRNQLGDEVDISIEPCRRDTFPAIALAAAYLRDVKGLGVEEPVVVCPVDPYVDSDYFQSLKELEELAAAGRARLVLMGIEPDCPSEKYGYIIPKGKERVDQVLTFKEKPDTETAKEYIRQGALWNGGVFAFKLGYLMEKAHEILDFTDYQDLFDHYEEAKKISFDYAVAEKEPDIAVLRFKGRWEDLGTWNALTGQMDEKIYGRGSLDEACRGVHIVNELNIPILCMGLRDAVVAASPEGILVAAKERSAFLKPYAEAITRQVHVAEKSWGEFCIVDVEKESLTIRLTLLAGRSMSYHSHEHRDEVWTVLSGSGQVTLDGARRQVGPGDVVRIPAGCRHMVKADTRLQMIEVQLGQEISVHDKQKYESREM